MIVCCFFINQKYERRGRHLLEEERERWQDVLPTMMSDEEEGDGGEFAVHRPVWRSHDFNILLQELDERALSSNPKRPRYTRTIGSPRSGDPPSEAKRWMIATPDSPAPNSPASN